MKKSLLYLSIFAIIACFTFTACDDDNDPKITEPPVEESIFPKKELRGVWVATVYGLDWPQGKYTEAAQKQFYKDYLDKFVETNINAVFVQIRGKADAFYDSPYEPWTVELTGTANGDPGYDVLQFLIDETHARGLEFHAWLNPYRIATRSAATASFPALDSRIDPTWVKDYATIRLYNPALPDVQDRIIDIVSDVVTKYDVDGIHIDDYFYPYPEYYTNGLEDAAEFATYGGEYTRIEDFRRGNVDKVVQRMYNAIVQIRPSAVFSVAPAGDIDYNFNTLYADVIKWYDNQWADMFIPQIYSATGNPTTTTTFNSRLSVWSQYYKTKAALIVGHALYKFGDGTSSGFQTTKELTEQFRLINKVNGVQGSVLYDARAFFANRINIIDVLKEEVYKNPAVRPFVGRKTLPDPTPATGISQSGTTLTWTAAAGLSSVVYVIPTDETKAKVAAILTTNTFTMTERGKYFISTVNRNNVESEVSAPIIY